MKLNDAEAESGQVVALQALAWLAGHEDLLGVFMGASGLSQSDLAAGAHDPAFLASVLDFLVMDDAWIVAFCDANALPYHAPLEARQRLAGRQETHWT